MTTAALSRVVVEPGSALQEARAPRAMNPSGRIEMFMGSL
jgi:hypothetical protein